MENSKNENIYVIISATGSSKFHKKKFMAKVELFVALKRRFIFVLQVERLRINKSFAPTPIDAINFVILNSYRTLDISMYTSLIPL